VGELRATDSGEKAERRRQILQSTNRLFERWSYTDVTIDRIADLTGIAKGTLYLYFRTKETLFLSLYEEHLFSWYSELETLAARGTGSVEPAAAARVFASTLAVRSALVRLHGLIHSENGRNIDVATFVDFRHRQSRRMSSLASALAGRIANLSTARALHFLVLLEAIVGGLSRAAFPPPPVSRAYGDDDLAVFGLDFEAELTRIIAALLQS
jgi:AcrR family transcriptional regulator